jgi:phage shock protein PspC (stress-responsive transcriptional regulator)
MNKVVTISLNGNPYQLEEAAYDALRAYLDGARGRLEGDPGRDEILADLEQSIAEKLTRLMAPHKTVANAEDMRKALEEMGPVEGAEKEAPGPDAERAQPKRLHTLPKQGIIGGVCAGLAAYLDLDVTVVRIIFVGLTLLTSGAWILLYFIMMTFVPSATTAEEEARAAGKPYTAQDVVDRAKEGIENLRSHSRRWKQERREWKRQYRAEQARLHHSHYAAYAYRRPSVIGEIFQLVILGLIVWGAYAFIPATHPFYMHVGDAIQNGWAWLNAKVAH